MTKLFLSLVQFGFNFTIKNNITTIEVKISSHQWQQEPVLEWTSCASQEIPWHSHVRSGRTHILWSIESSSGAMTANIHQDITAVYPPQHRNQSQNNMNETSLVYKVHYPKGCLSYHIICHSHFEHIQIAILTKQPIQAFTGVMNLNDERMSQIYRWYTTGKT